MPTFVRRSRLEAPASSVFAWHERPGAYERLLPPWEDARLIRSDGSLRDGCRAELRMHIGPLPVRWIAEHRGYQAGVRFTDVQVAGPFAKWEHTHSVTPLGPHASELEDRIDYELPLGWLGRCMGGTFVNNKLEKVFNYRHQTLEGDLKQNLHATRTMNVLVSGASGLVGSALTPCLFTAGHNVVRLSRGGSDPNAVRWDPLKDELESQRLEGLDGIVHLAGESIAGRWSASKKAAILESRVRGTRLLAQSMARLQRKPKVFVCASAIGIYGHRDDEVLAENSSSGRGFLAEVCRAWEDAAAPARDAGIRVVFARLGIVLSPKGGALAKMLLPFKFGAGGIVGSGKQWWSWIDLEDAVGAIQHALTKSTLEGPMNVVAPHPETNHAFTKTLGRVLCRPTIFPMPAFAAKLALGEMAEELLLASTRVEARKLKESGYTFRYSTLEASLRHLLGK